MQFGSALMNASMTGMRQRQAGLSGTPYDPTEEIVNPNEREYIRGLKRSSAKARVMSEDGMGSGPQDYAQQLARMGQQFHGFGQTVTSPMIDGLNAAYRPKTPGVR